MKRVPGVTPPILELDLIIATFQNVLRHPQLQIMVEMSVQLLLRHVGTRDVADIWELFRKPDEVKRAKSGAAIHHISPSSGPTTIPIIIAETQERIR